MHFIKEIAALARAPGERGDSLDEFALFGRERIVTNLAAFLQQRAERDAFLILSGREIERGGGHGKTRRIDLEKFVDDAIGDLVIAAATYAVDVLIGEEEAEKERKRESARGDAQIMFVQKRREFFGGGFGGSSRLEDEREFCTVLERRKRPLIILLTQDQSLARFAFQIVEPKWCFNFFRSDFQIRHGPARRGDVLLATIIGQSGVIGAGEPIRIGQEMMGEDEVGLTCPEGAHQGRLMAEIQFLIDLLDGTGQIGSQKRISRGL